MTRRTPDWATMLSRLEFVRSVRKVRDGLFEASVKTEDLARELESDHLEQVRGVFDSSFTAVASEHADLDLTGWSSGITRAPIDRAVMVEWVQTTVTTLLELDTARVLEIGCGTGLLTQRVAPHSDHYVGTDLSPRVLDRIRRNLTRSGHDLSHVHLRSAAADEPVGDGFSLVILNSIVQYFPSTAYLADVLRVALQALAPGGTIFVGDVRNLALLPDYATEVARAQSVPGTGAAELARQSSRRQSEEPELVLHPDWFRVLPRILGTDLDLDIRLKEGGDNELTRYRFDVLISRPRPRPSVRTLTWNGDAEAVTALATTRPVLLRDVADRRPLDPALADAAARDGLRIRRQWPASGRPGFTDLLVSTPDPEIRALCDGPAPKPGRPLANDPLAGRVVRELGRRWSADLARRAPSWTEPIEIRLRSEHPPEAGEPPTVVLLPTDGPPAETGDETSVRAVVLRAWQSVLAVDRVDPEDDFFALGGHSLLAAQIVTRLRRELGVDVALRELMTAPTFEEMVELVGQARVGADATGEGTAIRSVPPSERVPASAAQHQLWFLHQENPHDTAYHVPLALPLAEPADPAALRAALTRLVDRHEALRTRFADVDGLPYQEVATVAPPPMPIIDPVDRPDAVEELLRAAFDLASGVLLRSALLRSPGRPDSLLLVIHHIATDGRSMHVLLDDLSRLYLAERDGSPAPPPPPAVSYRDAAVWQRERLTDDLLNRQLSYWRRRLDGLDALPELPADRPGGTGTARRGALLHFDLGADLGAGLRRLAAERQATLFVVLLSGFGVLLSRITGSHDVVIGVPMTNRPHPDLEDVVGLFVNTVPLRLSLAGEPRFADLVDRVRHDVLEAQANQDVPYSRLVRECLPAGASGRASLVQVVLSFQNTGRQGIPAAPPAFAPTPLSQAELDKGGSKFEVSLSLEETPEGLRGLVEYDCDLWEQATIKRLVGHLSTLLKAAVADPEAPVGALDPLTGADRRELAEMSAGPITPAPLLADLCDLVAHWSAATPDAPAVVAGDLRLTYRELHQRAAGLAADMTGAGLEPGGVVGVHLPRGIDLVVAVLAVVHAGGTYLPLDSGYPAERRAHMVEDAGATIVITGGSSLGREILGTARQLRIDESTVPEKTSPPVRVAADSPAYIVYTSGSTGVPKGVVVPRSAVVNLVHEPVHCTVRPGDRVAQVATPNFDAFTFELWAAVAAGATVVVLDPDDLLDADALAASIRRERLTAMFVTTAVFELVSRQRPDAFAPLDTLLFGGEAIDVARVADVLQHGAPSRLVHVYGPTETTTFASYHDVTEADVRSGVLPIGTPLQNVGLHVLDERMHPVPVGAAGQLCITGRGLALGYLGMDEATEQAFPSAPGGDGPPPAGTRLYRTGDRVRRLPSGELLFLGRVDRQVKIRGHRVELGEVEAALIRLPEVADAAVTIRRSGLGTQLTAVVVRARTHNRLSGTDLAGRLARVVPGHLVPDLWALVEALPLNANGKTDPAALERLAETAATGTVPATAVVAPRDEIEQSLWDIWSRLLERRDFGVTDDFFALGGHSLLVGRIVAAVRDELAVEIGIRSVFDRPTVEQLAHEVLTRGLEQIGAEAREALMTQSEADDV